MAVIAVCIAHHEGSLPATSLDLISASRSIATEFGALLYGVVLVAPQPTENYSGWVQELSLRGLDRIAFLQTPNFSNESSWRTISRGYELLRERIAPLLWVFPHTDDHVKIAAGMAKSWRFPIIRQSHWGWKGPHLLIGANRRAAITMPPAEVTAPRVLTVTAAPWSGAACPGEAEVEIIDISPQDAG